MCRIYLFISAGDSDDCAGRSPVGRIDPVFGVVQEKRTERAGYKGSAVSEHTDGCNCMNDLLMEAEKWILESIRLQL